MNYAIGRNGQIFAYSVEQPKGTRAIRLKIGTWEKVQSKYSHKYRWLNPAPSFPMYKNKEELKNEI